VKGVADARDRAVRFRSRFEDEGEFRAWYENALPKVYAYLHLRCGGQRVLAEELTQETFVEAIRNRARFDGRSDDTTWLIAIARHKLADHFRRLAREGRRQLRLIEGASTAASEDPSSFAETKEDILAALASLPSLQRAVLVLHYLDGLTVTEIARELGKAEGAIGSLMTRGRESLRRMLAHEETADD
jgi:RNA polymerase sigma-70 factor (ECF subfamily)